jgi:sarcosine oxidase subunit gamma
VTDLALASLAPRKGQSTAPAEAFLGLSLPGPGAHAFGTPFSATWLEPGTWLISAPLSSHETLPEALKAAVSETASITEQSFGWCAFALEGGDAPAVLEKLAAVDLSSWARGQAARLRFEHLSCLVICMDPRTSWLILGPRSSAGSLHHAIEVTAGAP